MKVTDYGFGIMKLDEVLEPAMCQMIIDKFDADKRKILEIPEVDPKAHLANYRKCSAIYLREHEDWNIYKAVLSEALRASFIEYTKKYECGQTGAVDRGAELVCYMPGEVCNLHADGGPMQLRIFCSAIIFLNTVAKGELCFPEQKLEIPPKAGSVLLFPSNYTHPHKTNPSKMKRYVVVNFLAHKEYKL